MHGRDLNHHGTTRRGAVGRGGAGKVPAAGLRRQLALDRESEATGDEETGDGHEHLEAFGALLPQVVVRLAVLLA